MLLMVVGIVVFVSVAVDIVVSMLELVVVVVVDKLDFYWFVVVHLLICLNSYEMQNVVVDKFFVLDEDSF